jgi:hypothetical protein
MGLDAVAAALQSGSGTGWGLVFTGLLIGLGSNPTHEVVKALQEYKNSKAAANA